MTTGAPGQDRDAIRDAALDWLLRINAAPDDTMLRARRDAWLAERDEHARAYRKAERAWRLAGDVPPAHADRWAAKPHQVPGVAAKEGTRIGTAADPASSAVHGRMAGPARRGWTLAVGALAACAAFVFVAPAVQVRLQADFVTAVGQDLQATLEDGTVVYLDSDTAIGTHFTAAGREASLLSGRAFFQVVPDAQRPFSVHAGIASVTVTGTAFTVDMTASAISVAVQSGSVEVSVGPGHQNEARLSPGERLQIDRVTRTVTRGTVAVSQIAAWRHSQLVVENAPISQVVDELRRYHRGFIFLRDDALARRRVSGVFDLRDPAAALRAAVQPYAGTVHEWVPQVLVISGS